MVRRHLKKMQKGPCTVADVKSHHLVSPPLADVKLNNLPIVIENLVWGHSLPQNPRSFVSGVEFIGGILLLLGLFTRVAAVPLVIVMIVAITAKGMRSTR